MSQAADAVRLDRACVRYGAIEALHDVSLTLPAGTVTAIIGPNGSGKSTLVGLLSGLVRPSSGSVEVLGAPVGAHRREVAHVLQTTAVEAAGAITVFEAVRMGAYGRRGVLGRLTREDRARVRRALERLDIAELAGRSLEMLSGGQRQRVHVAQGLAQGASVLVLDEPIAGLDLVSQEVIARVVTEERAVGHTVVVTTHDVGTAADADLVVLLATEVVAFGPPSEVLTPHHLTHAYGGHAHLLEDGTVIIDDPHHHGAHAPVGGPWPHAHDQHDG
jgi:manganese transport system ATP-binding protein